MKIAYDAKLKRPGCVILQAVLGCDSKVAHAFDSQHWLTSPTPDMKIYEVSEDQLQLLVRVTDAHAKNQANKKTTPSKPAPVTTKKDKTVRPAKIQ